MIPNLEAVQCIYQVSNKFQALPAIEQSFTDNLFCDMLQESKVPTIQASLRSKKIMMFPLYYIPDKHFLLAIVQPDIPYIHFLDTRHGFNQEQFFLQLFPLFLSSYLDQGVEWEYIWVHRHKDVQETTDSAIFVCVYMYLVMELNQRKYILDNILKVILPINQSTLIENKIRSNIALSLLQKIFDISRCYLLPVIFHIHR